MHLHLPLRASATPTTSVAPNHPPSIYRPGQPFTIHSVDELKAFQAQQGKLCVLECKSSHCRPCKKFAATYLELAERFKDCIFLEVVGDESPATRKMMVGGSGSGRECNGQQAHPLRDVWQA